MEIPSFNQIIAQSIKDYWDLDALSDYGVSTLQYKDVARLIEKLHIIFENTGVKPGDKIALCGPNSARWGAAFFATLTYGAVVVPILHEFHPAQVHDIVNHSESRLLLVSDKIWGKLDQEKMPDLEGVMSLEDYSLKCSRSEKLSYARENLNKLFGERYPMNFRAHHINYYQDSPEELAIINYTSGTTSNSKGVMIPYRAIWSNSDFAKDVLGAHLHAGQKVLSMLPMAHTYGMSFEFIYEFMIGVHINYLTKAPSPNVLLKALSDIRPCVLIVVPLIIEKIVRKAVMPRVQDPKVRMLMKMPIIGDRIKEKICKGLTDALGGNFYEVIIGGAALNQEVEALLHEIGFRYTVGYGATECAPIICYNDWKDQVPGSCGKAALHMEVKIDSINPQRVAGEILARGINVMLGYYKNDEATSQTLDSEGWYHTGDLGIMDEQGNVFIKGRSKNMLLSANGQNIYPEEIEDRLNSMALVNECIVIQRDAKLYGLVFPDMEKAKKLMLSDADLDAVMEQNRKELNAQLPNYSQVARIKVFDQEFEKTPKKSIKRFMYQDVDI